MSEPFSGDFEDYPPRLNESSPRGRFNNAKEFAQSLVGQLVYQKRNYQRFLFVSLIANIILSSALVYVSTRGEFVPYVIERDMQTGQAVAVGPASQKEYIPQEAEVTYFLAKFIENARTVPLDPVVYRRQWNVANMFLTAHSSEKINKLIAEENQPGQIGLKTVLPKILSIQPLADTANTYQVRWLEESFVISGISEQTNVVMSGIFSIEYIRPKTEKDLLVNPLGIYIKDFSWTKESEIKK